MVVADLGDADARADCSPRRSNCSGGPVDVLVKMPRPRYYQPLADYPLTGAGYVEVNVHAPLDLMQAALPSMLEAGRGWIVNVSSASAGLTAEPPFDLRPPGTSIGVYAASKAALNRLSNLMAAELSGSGIRVNTVEPRAAVLSEGAAALVGETLGPDEVESLEEMVEAVTALCDCPEAVTGRTGVSLDLIREWDLTVRGLDAQPWQREEISA